MIHNSLMELMREFNADLDLTQQPPIVVVPPRIRRGVRVPIDKDGGLTLEMLGFYNGDVARFRVSEYSHNRAWCKCRWFIRYESKLTECNIPVRVYDEVIFQTRLEKPFFLQYYYYSSGDKGKPTEETCIRLPDLNRAVAHWKTVKKHIIEIAGGHPVSLTSDLLSLIAEY